MQILRGGVMSNEFEWPINFPDVSEMKDLLYKMAKSSWQNENDFNSDNIQRWLNNFSGQIYSQEIEQRLALWLLCNFTYYNENEISHLCRDVFKKLLHRIAISNNIDSDEGLHHIFDNVYFAAMGDPSESGGLLLYFFRQQSGLSVDKFYYPSALPQDESGILVFIDDVTLSGGSASRFFKKNIKSMKFRSAYYLTLFAGEEAISVITESGLNVIQAMILGNRERCFTDESLIYAEFPELKEPSKRIAEAYGHKLSPSYPLGHKNGQYCFGMYYNTPNNSLPIFWSSNNWVPIFPRKEKRVNGRRPVNYDKYI